MDRDEVLRSLQAELAIAGKLLGPKDLTGFLIGWLVGAVQQQAIPKDQLLAAIERVWTITLKRAKIAPP